MPGGEKKKKKKRTETIHLLLILHSGYIFLDTQDEYNTYTNDMTLDGISWKVDAYINCWGDSLDSPLIIEYQTI